MPKGGIVELREGGEVARGTGRCRYPELWFWPKESGFHGGRPPCDEGGQDLGALKLVAIV